MYVKEIKNEKPVTSKYFSENQKFWHRAIIDRIWMAKKDIIKEQKRAAAVHILIAAITTALCTMMCAFVGYLKR